MRGRGSVCTCISSESVGGLYRLHSVLYISRKHAATQCAGMEAIAPEKG